MGDTKITDLKFDENNFNLGSEYGQELGDLSIKEVGVGRSILTDKNNVVVAGNKTLKTALNNGIKKIIEVETTGDELVVVKRIDLDINSIKGIKMKILDNTVSKHNYIEDTSEIIRVTEDYGIDAGELGVAVYDEEAEIENEGGNGNDKPGSLNSITVEVMSKKQEDVLLTFLKINNFSYSKNL